MQAGPRAGSPNAARYREWIGKGWNATHHYCWGLDEMLIASLNISDENKYSYYLGNAIGDFNYVLKRVSDHFILKPEILSRKGMALSLLERNVEATSVFLSAINLKPDFVYPYIQLSKLYSKKGEIKKAQEILDRGLEHSPNSSLLKEALAELHKKK